MEEESKEGRSWEEDMYWSHFQCVHFIQYLQPGFDQLLVSQVILYVRDLLSVLLLMGSFLGLVLV